MLRPVPLFLLAASISALLTSHAQAQPAPTFPGGVETVRIDAVVLDKEGRPVTGLTAADFEVEENGKKRAISSFEAVVVRSKPAMSPAPSEESEEVVPFVAPRVVAPEDGRAILVFFDDLHVSAPHAEWARSQLASYLSRELRDGDLVGVVSPGTHAWWFAATPAERERLPIVLSALRGRLVQRDERPLIGVVGRGGPEAHVEMHQPPVRPFEAMRIDECYEDCMNIDPEKKMIARTIYAVEQRDIRLTLGNLAQALAALERLPGRKTLLFVSEGFLLLPREKAVPYERAIELARRANVVVEWIDPSGVTAGPVAPTAEAATKLLKPVPDPRDQPAFSRDAELAGTRFVATSTGGREFFSNDPTDGARRALDESSVYYLIGYVPVGGPPGERKVRVQVKREGCTVRARSRYFVRAPEAAAVGGAALRQAVDAFADASELPFRLAVEPADSAISMNDIAGSRLLVAIDPAGGPPRERTLEMLVEARPLGVGEPVRESVRLSVPAASRPLGVARPLALGPGVWQVRVALQDVATGALGSARQTVEVPADR